MTTMLFPDPRFRSPTAVASRRSVVPIVIQKQVSAAQTEVIRPNCECSFYGVAAMSHCDLEARLIVKLPDGSRSEFPLNYLAALWPQHFKLQVPLRLSQDGDIQLDVYGPPDGAVVVLLGSRLP